MDIYFKLSKTCQTSDKLPIKNSINHKYRINDELDEISSNRENKLKELKESLESLGDDSDKEWNEVTLPALTKELEDLKVAQSNLAFFSFIRKQKIANRIEEINREIALHNSDKSSAENQKKEINKQIEELEASKLPEKIPEALIEEWRFLSIVYDATNFLIEEEPIIKHGDYLISVGPTIKRILDTNQLSYQEMYKKVMLSTVTDLCNKYHLVKAPNSVRIESKFHTFNLYLTLALANLFLDKPAARDKLICFDEGQEYSPNEYTLILEINSDEDLLTLVNVYGDVNQRSSAKGISNWKQIDFISDSIFELKENYRNSKEIVDYTNKQLGLSDIAIGVDEGIPVKEVSMDAAIEEVAKGDICIILKEGNGAYNALLNKGLINFKNRGVIVLSPVLAKGQEFPKVIVFDKDMDNIDKYVSYTRAKVELLVCKDF